MLEVTENTDVYTDVYTADDKHVGCFLPEDKFIHFEDISTATPERITLSQGVDPARLDPFVERDFVPVDETDLPEGDVVYDPGFVSAWYGPDRDRSPAAP